MVLRIQRKGANDVPGKMVEQWDRYLSGEQSVSSLLNYCVSHLDNFHFDD